MLVKNFEELEIWKEARRFADDSKAFVGDD
jgi:hypothetical protein